MSSAIDFAAQIVPTRTKSRYAHLLCWRDEFFSNCAILRMAPHPFGKMLMQLAATEAAFRAKKLGGGGRGGGARRAGPGAGRGRGRGGGGRGGGPRGGGGGDI